MRTDTVKDRREALKAEFEAKKARLDFEERVLADLPDDLPRPTVSNESEKAFFGHPGAWVSFHRGYGETWKSSDILARLEAAGYKPMPSSLVKWDDWRRHAEPGACDDIPETKGSYKLSEVEAIVGVWLQPNNHTEPDAHCFYKSPSGLIIKISIPAPYKVFLHCQKVEVKGGWYYDGKPELRFPQEWHAVNDSDGRTLANVNVHSRAYKDTPQGLSGTLYFTPLYEQEEFPVTHSQFLALLGA